MKRFLLSAASALIAVSGFSQTPTIGKVSPDQRGLSIAIPVHFTENQNPNAEGTINNFSAQRMSATEVQIGNTYYDLQTNSGIQRRIIRNSNGTIVATWTFSTDAAWNTRGTGYNYFNGTTWGTAPTAPIESERTGWPNPLITGQGKELVISHSTANNILRKVDRSSVGTGSWSQVNLTSQSQQVWSRSAVGGTNNNTIHMIGMSLPVANGGSIGSTGMDGAFYYSRSTNGGTSWDIVDYQIPGTDSSWFDGFDGDSYHIDAKGNTVAIVVGGLGRGVQLYKSTNNGVSWTKTDVLLSDKWFVESETLIPDNIDSALFTSDGGVNVLIDDNNMCHVWFGAMYISNSDLTDGTFSYYPGTNSIEYWNEDFPVASSLSLAGALDINGNGTLDLIGSVLDAVGQYRLAGLATHPQAGIDGDGCIYVTYDAIREDLSNGQQHYRHTYVMSTCDYGCTWSFPIDVTGSSNNDFAECVFPSIARSVSDDIHVIYMSDVEPGIAVSGDMDNPQINKIIYLKEDADRFTDTVDFCPVEIYGDTLICNGGSLDLYILGCGTAFSWSGPGGFTSTNQNVSVTTAGTYTCSVTTACGSTTLTHEVDSYTGSNGPQVSIQATQLSMCDGDTTVLTALSSVAGVSYLWDNNLETTSSITVYNSPATYTVTVTDCNNGTTVKSIHISEPSTPPAAIITGDLTLCTGDQTTLTATAVSGGSYTWTSGATTRSITVSAAGTYTCTVTNCGGSSSTSVEVTIETLPTASVNAPSNEGCEGEALTATASGGETYMWPGGSTDAQFSIDEPSESGTYVVTVYNDCGDEDTASITLTIFASPASPSITFNGTSFVSSQTGSGTHQWYIGGVLVSGITGNELPWENYVEESQLVYCTYTDENGCVSAASAGIVGVDEYGVAASPITIYPNPNNGRFDVRFGNISGETNVSVTNTLGQTVYSRQLQVKQGQAETIQLDGLDAGAYLMRIEHAGEQTLETVIIR